MQFGSTKERKMNAPFLLRGKSASHFCIFPSVEPDSYDPGHTPVYLNVYDLTRLNSYFYWAGFGIFHSGVEVHGSEYAFGAHETPSSGVFEVEPRQCPGFKFRRSIFIGTTGLDALQVRRFMECHSKNYNGDMYHLIAKNCNHFSKDVCHQLTGKPIPKWVNRLAEIGSNFNCVMPESVGASLVRHNPSYGDSERRKLTNAFSCLSSLSSRQMQFSSSSLFLPSPVKDFRTPQQMLRKSKSGLQEER